MDGGAAATVRGRDLGAKPVGKRSARPIPGKVEGDGGAFHRPAGFVVNFDREKPRGARTGAWTVPSPSTTWICKMAI